MMSLKVNNIQKSFGNSVVLENISFELQPREIIAILGPSGSGKSTLLKILAGLEQPDNGVVLWNGSVINDLPPYKRNFGLMFQELALFPHKNVFENIAFGLRMAQKPADEIQRRVKEVLELVGLPDFEERDVNSLSGGEAQRVALARSLAPEPQLLMLDEPLGSLDRNLRERLVVDLRNILQKSKQTAIYVTHDQTEAFTLAHRILILNKGKFEQFDTAKNIYQHPATTFVARFLGLENIFRANIYQKQKRRYAETAIGTFPIQADTEGKKWILIRPDIDVLNPNGDFELIGTIRERNFQGAFSKFAIDVKGNILQFTFPSNYNLPNIGEKIKLSLDSKQAIQIFDY